MKIGPYPIGEDRPPFVIAEMSGNHNRSLDRALEIVDAAAAAGAHAIKLQTYRADTITLDADGDAFRIDDERSLWHDRRLYDLYAEAHTPWEWHRPIMERAAALGMACFSSPFDFEAVEFLESLGACAYKIASFEITHLPLVRACAKTGKPLIISTGMATLEEIKDAVLAATEAGATEIALLKCTSQYPADASDANLATLADLRRRFPGAQVGLSDHTHGTGVPAAAVALGATIIEKHFTLRRADGGVDSAFSLEPEELAQLVRTSRETWERTRSGTPFSPEATDMSEEDRERARRARGEVRYGGGKNEDGSRRFRQSLWIAEDVKEGEALTPKNLLIRRPSAGGLAPKHYEAYLGRKLRRDATKGTPLTAELVA
jgi:pseudaminic acid synthase